MPRLPRELVVTRRVRIPAAELVLSYARSGGPGGQHVNKTATKVVLRWNARTSTALSDEDRALLEERLAAGLTEAGELIVTSERSRDQRANVEDALAKLVARVRAALHRDRPRRKTRPPRRARERRLADKKRRGETKRLRRPPAGA